MPKNALSPRQFDTLTPLMSALLQEEALTSRQLTQSLQAEYTITAAQAKHLTTQWLLKANAQSLVSPKQAYNRKSTLWALTERKSLLSKASDQALVIISVLGVTFKDPALTLVNELVQAFALAPQAMTGLCIAATGLVWLTRRVGLRARHHRRQHLVQKLVRS